MAKKLQDNSALEMADLNNDGVVTDDELRLQEKIIQIENDNAREDAQRGMAWFALFGMLLYPIAVVVAVWLGLDKASDVLGDMAPTYFVSVAAIVAAFYGGQAYSSRGKNG